MKTNSRDFEKWLFEARKAESHKRLWIQFALTLYVTKLGKNSLCLKTFCQKTFFQNNNKSKNIKMIRNNWRITWSKILMAYWGDTGSVRLGQVEPHGLWRPRSIRR
jgi:hypothetical protein